MNPGVRDPLELPVGETFTVIDTFLRDEVRRAGFRRVVLGLSGGIDSALSAFLAVRALGKENVHCVKMPYRLSSEASVSDADLVTSKLGCSSETVEITPMVEPFFAENPDMNNLRRGNVMARERMIVLYDRSAKNSALVLGTSNKTEGLLGYTTQFGDNASAINPIGDLYKTQVRQLSQVLGVPESVIKKAPTADLWAGQTDEGEMGFSLRDADRVLYYMVDERESDDELFARGFEKNFVEKIRAMVRKSQYKRMTPVIAKLGGRTINVDFRYPRDWGN
ncbi:MAG TPA: NAD+ synthase [Candidatus Kapabacteria bacterium]|nr:NAD+ synthase [Candidatus Kapabacteria bacterium]